MSRRKSRFSEIVADQGEGRAHATAVTISATEVDALQERAAIMEYDGGLARESAEGEAVRALLPSILATGAAEQDGGGSTAQAAVDPGDPRLRPFVVALAALLFADLQRSPPDNEGI